MKNLIVIGHTNEKSFCYNGIMKTIKMTLEQNKEEVWVIDLYAENKTFVFESDKIKEYKK